MNVISKALLSAAVIMASLSQASAGVIIGALLNKSDFG